MILVDTSVWIEFFSRTGAPMGSRLHAMLEAKEDLCLTAIHLTEILQGMTQVAEGVWTVKAIAPLAQKLGVEMPICGEVYRVLYESKSPKEAIRDLMTRSPKSERPSGGHRG